VGYYYLFIAIMGTIIVVVNGYNSIREASTNDDLIDRGSFDWLLDRTYGKKLGLIFSSSTFWNEVRLYTVRTLRDFGFGKTHTMEVYID